MTTVLLSHLTPIYEELGRTQEAIALYEHRAELARRRDSQGELIATLGNLSYHYAHNGNLDRARAALREWATLASAAETTTAPFSLLGWIEYLMCTNQHQQAAEWLGLHMAHNTATGAIISRQRQQCSGVIGELNTQAALERGRLLPFANVIMQIRSTLAVT